MRHLGKLSQDFSACLYCFWSRKTFFLPPMHPARWTSVWAPFGCGPTWVTLTLSKQESIFLMVQIHILEPTSITCNCALKSTLLNWQAPQMSTLIRVTWASGLIHASCCLARTNQIISPLLEWNLGLDRSKGIRLFFSRVFFFFL